ncbi:MAG: aldo/keto reductase [Planctomycetota bacterium]
MSALRPLGRSGLSVPPLAFGAYAIGGTYWGPSDDDAAVDAIVRAFEGGITAVDTAPVYGFGHSERLVARARRRLGSDGGRLLVMTKVGLRWDDDRGKFGFETRGPDGRNRRVYRNGRPDSIANEIDACLDRLECDALDLVQVHAPDPTTPVADTLGALKEAHDAGKVRAVGVSNFDVEQVVEADKALGHVPLASVQSLYSALERGIEGTLVPHAAERGIAVVAYSPLDQGLLTGKVREDRTFGPGDARARRPSFTAENRARVNEVLDATVAPIAAAHGVTLAQTMLAWTVLQPGITCALVGARSLEQAAENAAALELVLAQSELEAIRAAFEGLTLLPRPVTLGDRFRGFVHRVRFGR